MHLKPKPNVCCCNACVFIYLFIGCIYNRLYWVGSQWIFLFFFFNCFLLNAASGARTEILKQQQLLAVNVSSPPTRDTGLCHRTSSGRFLSHSPRSSHWSHNRSVCSLHSVQLPYWAVFPKNVTTYWRKYLIKRRYLFS